MCVLFDYTWSTFMHFFHIISKKYYQLQSLSFETSQNFNKPPKKVSRDIRYGNHLFYVALTKSCINVHKYTKSLKFLKETKSFLNTLAGLKVKTYMQYTIDLSYSHNPRLLHFMFCFWTAKQSKTKWIKMLFFLV